MNSDIIEALVRIAKEKNIEKDALREIIENIFYQMIEKYYGSADNFDIIVNIDKGDIEIYQEMTVVADDEELIEDQYDIPLSEAVKDDEEAEVGDEFVKIVDPSEFGRRLITNAKQTLLQKIRDFEKEQIVDEYSERIGEIIIGDIHDMNRRGIYLNLDKVEIFLPREEQIPNERLRRGERVRGVITKVRSTSRGPEVIVSRRDPLFLTRLFELEVPEIYDDLIEIRSVARIPGERAKVAVEAIDKRIDPVGACVGMKGSRIQAVTKELNDERIDIVNYHAQMEVYIARALSPAKPIRLVFDEEENSAIAVISDEEMAQAIGIRAQNLNLAQELTGVEIELVKESEYLEETQKLENDPSTEELLYDIVGPNILMKLRESGYEELEDLRDATLNELIMVPGVDRKTAEKIAGAVAKYDESQESSEVEEIEETEDDLENIEAEETEGEKETSDDK
jgi:N utilization substance protein A